MRAYLTDRNLRRALVLVLFVGSLVFFRHLVLLLIFFVVFSRTIGGIADSLRGSFPRIGHKTSTFIALAILLGVLGTGVSFSVVELVHHLPGIRQGIDTIVDTVRNSATFARYHVLFEEVTSERVLEQARHHAMDMVHVAGEVGRGALYVVLGLIFAVVFLIERQDLETWREKMDPDSMPRILLRYFGYVTDSIAITLKLQVIVAIVNAVVTIPVLLILRLPGVPALIAMLLVTGLIPIVGGPVAGGVLMTLAYVTRGPVGLVVFIVSTFFLHKVESYYLNPRLTAKHVKLPSFVIITSLVLFEHAFGVIGLFMSFPSLYVAAKIREGWVDPEDEARDDREVSERMRGMLPRLVRSFGIKRVPAEALRARDNREGSGQSAE